MTTSKRMTSVGLVIRATSPISHASDEKAGNQQMVRRMPVIDRDGVRHDVPVVSGNAVRGQLRRIAADDMLRRCGVEKVPQRLYHTLFSGGTLTKGEAPSTSHKIEEIRALRDLIPMIGLFGGTWKGEILPGWLLAGIFWPICRETSGVLGHNPDGCIEARTLTSDVFYTRRDDEDGTWTKEEATDAKSAMIFDVETVVAGTRFACEFRLRPARSEAALGLFAFALGEWEKAGVIGGQSSRGHGCFDVESRSEDIGQLAGLYEDHMGQKRAEIRAWLESEGASMISE